MQTIEANILDYYQAQKKNLRQLKNTLVAYNIIERDEVNRNNNRVTIKKLVGLVEDIFDFFI
jgi:hypothetical protein